MPETQKIHHFVEQQAALIPQKVALSFYDKQLTYAELNVKANQVAQFLIAQGAQKGDLIPIISEKSLESVVALLAILKIGAAYIPVNTESTESMMATVIEHSKAKILFAQSKVIPSVSAMNGLIIHLDYLFEKTSQYPVTNPDYLAHKSDLAYVIYTSGTTGLPKGVMVTHHNLIHTYLSWETVYQLTSSDVHLQMANPAFDVFAGDWLRALCSGAKLVLCPKDVLLKPAHLYQLIVNQK
nr:AMP-binding protein [Legionella tunisiensis]